MAEFGESLVTQILSGLGRLVGIFGGGAQSSYLRAFEGLRSVLLDVGEATANYIEESRSWLSSLIGIFRRFYASGILPLLKWLREKFLALREWLRRVFKPLFEFLLRLRRELLDFYVKFIRPILDVIEAIRFGLQALGRLGVEWAAELDRKLGQITSAIDERFRVILGKLNAAIDLVNEIVSPELLIRRIPLIRSLDNAAGYWLRMWWNHELKGVKAAAHAPGRGPKYSRRRPDVDAAEISEFWRTRGGPRAAVITELSATFQIALGVAPQLEPDE